MQIHLKDIDNDNWIECIFLTTNKEGQHFINEEFVASNAVSIAQSKIENGWITKAIYDEDQMIGFTMYGFSYEDHCYDICRMMIDHKFQGQGYGKAALGKVIEEMKKIEDCTEIFLSFEPENQIGKRLYESFNFQDTGKIVDGELLYSLKLK
ncbi:GNAT family N-acetyltransferase [Paenibacillus segetis]|uniref:Diamine N-acetyltransferase n=1 Tax=Paenibacillus segetis TaxID=1325360 RepID=A0ABQ1YMR0_9BACL|nr:GNAT family N-acetyltransferase [Paenibacillus segetis]GGH31140.1 diamine N-acetyltransferase [Paenibacillus segetis]